MTQYSTIQYFKMAADAREKAIAIATNPVSLEGRLNLPTAAFPTLIELSTKPHYSPQAIKSVRN